MFRVFIIFLGCLLVTIYADCTCDVCNCVGRLIECNTTTNISSGYTYIREVSCPSGDCSMSVGATTRDGSKFGIMVLSSMFDIDWEHGGSYGLFLGIPPHNPSRACFSQQYDGVDATWMYVLIKCMNLFMDCPVSLKMTLADEKSTYVSEKQIMIS